MPNWFKVLLSFIVTGILIGFIGVFYSEDVRQVVEGQLGKLRENRITQAYYDYSAKTFQETTSLPDFRKFIARYPAISDNKKFLLDSQSVDNGQAVVTGLLISNDLQEMKVEYQLIKEDEDWKVLSISLQEFLHEDEEELAISELVDLVDKHLKSLRAEEVTEAYYGLLSKNFQRETPLPVFEKYVAEHPIFSNYEDAEFGDRRIENDKGYVDLILTSNSGRYLLEYQLLREQGNWKVWSLRVILPAEEAEKKAATNPEALVPPIRELLDALLVKNIEKAYNSTAKEFQEVTPYHSFEEFVISNPVLLRRDLADIKGGQIDNGVGKLHVNLHDEEGMTVFEFKLGFDEGEWKIWGMQIMDQPETLPDDNSMAPVEVTEPLPLANRVIKAVQDQFVALRHQDMEIAYEDSLNKKEEAPPKPLEFAKVVVGDATDDEGFITDPKTMLDPQADQFFTNIDIKNGKKKTKITLFLEHIDSGSSAPPLSTMLQQNGDSMLSLSYQAPTQGWPKGEYLLKVTASSGEEFLHKFQMGEAGAK